MFCIKIIFDKRITYALSDKELEAYNNFIVVCIEIIN